VLVTFPDYDTSALTDAGCDLRLAPKLGPRSPNELAALLEGVTAAVVSTDPFTPEVLRGASGLKVIARVGVGYDTIDIPTADALGIQVVTTPGANEHAVADHALAMILALLRRIPELDADIRGGGWNRTGAHTPRQLAGMTVGLIGYGNIGRRVGARLRGFDVELLVHDPFFDSSGGGESVPIDELLRRGQVVSLHCPLTAATRHLIDDRALGLMRPDAILVNTSRGGVVDEQALIDALRAGRIAGAALDVFDAEPPRDSPLLTMPNVVVSPHNAGLSTVSIAEMSRRASQGVIEALDGGVAADLVNPGCLEALGRGKAVV
jgi:D-3-phosphoglycerate dehydrogenase